MRTGCIFGSLLAAAGLASSQLIAQNATPAPLPASAEWAPDAAPRDGSVYRIALLADVHIDLTGQGDSVRFLPHLQTTIRQVNDANVDLVLIAGDLSNYGKKPEWADFRNGC